jgi:hypothetical protein
MNISLFPLAGSYSRLCAAPEARAVREPAPPTAQASTGPSATSSASGMTRATAPPCYPAGRRNRVRPRPGEWNLEAGPDFLNATLLLQPGARRVRGDVEVHVHPLTGMRTATRRTRPTTA